MSQECVFPKCSCPALPGHSKCNTHRRRSPCQAPDCGNQAYARGLCMRHGGKKKCAHPDCTANAFVGESCARHDTLQRTCCVHGCTTPAHVQVQLSRQDFPSWRLCLAHHKISVAELEGMLPYPEFLEYIDEVLDSMAD
ncbi:hypothetical protein AeRB84_019616 [Aphanomyces euteiches]|nr:hypothetical protein AeRB84_019616 [Aphanomyces euteiches]